ncbi:MAG: peptidase M41 [Olpidium bornovanus]|uniref:Peptidase M41 n=1 Tax=Olpidium bornovanus TaxID=278681 RepID=A0A8H7ZWN7_9FUNG|nr:MAG: peptidase M41 [Olpidium bornovanus]
MAATQASRLGHSVVTTKHMDHAKDRILMGAELRSKFITEETKKLTAYHEGGHALVAFYTPGAMPLHKATVMPRGNALGMVRELLNFFAARMGVVQLPEMDKENFTRKEYLAQLDVAMGGRVAEELIFGKENVTSGAMSDFANATGVARRMVTLFGMSDKIGPVYHHEDDIISAGMKATIEAEIKDLLEVRVLYSWVQGLPLDALWHDLLNARDRAAKILTDHMTELHRLALALIEFETLAQDEIESVLQGRTIAR